MRRVLQQHGVQLVVAVIGAAAVIIAALIASDTINIQVGDGSSTSKTERKSSPDGTETEPPSPPPTRVSLVKLNEQGDADTDGEYGTFSIGARPYDSGVSTLVYRDESGGPELELQTKGRFSRISGVVGIDGEADCLQTRARVWISDDAGTVLWGPTEVNSRSRETFSAEIEGAVRVTLQQRSLAPSDDSCDNGAAKPA